MWAQFHVYHPTSHTTLVFKNKCLAIPEDLFYLVLKAIYTKILKIKNSSVFQDSTGLTKTQGGDFSRWLGVGGPGSLLQIWGDTVEGRGSLGNPPDGVLLPYLINVLLQLQMRSVSRGTSSHPGA